jgi:hypothetical protein
MYANNLKIRPSDLMIDVSLALHILDKFVFGLDGSLILSVVDKKAKVFIHDVRIPSIIIIFEDLIKERLINV